MNSFWKDKRVLVTGAGGITGQNIIRDLLKRGSKVRAIEGKTRKVNIDHPNLRVDSFDLLDYSSCLQATYKCDIVINCAAVIKGAKGQKTSQLQLVRENVNIGVNMITSAVQNNVKRFGFIGSSTMYPPVEMVYEYDGFKGDPWVGYLGVGNMKRYLEKVCQQFANESETQFAIARTTALYGPFDDFNLETCHVIPALVNKICHKQNPLEIWGDGSEERNFIYIDDFIDGFLEVIEHPAVSPVNIANREISTVNDIIKYATKYVGYDPDRNYDVTKPTMIPKRIVSVEKAKKYLGWEAKTSLKEGLQKTIDWYRNNILYIEQQIENDQIASDLPGKK